MCNPFWHQRGAQQIGEKSKGAPERMLRIVEEATPIAGGEKVVEPFDSPRCDQAYTGMYPAILSRFILFR